MKRIAIVGATGFIGRALVAALADRGDEPIALVRVGSRKAALLPSGARVERYEPLQASPAVFEGLDAVVNLAGETVAGLWTRARKRRIYDSRVATTRSLVSALVQCKTPPPVLVSASAVGYYGSQGEEELAEAARPGAGFLAQLCVDWEREAASALRAGVRVVQVRQGIVLGRDGGALKPMTVPFKLGIGGKLGSGTQWWPWIHIVDDIAMILFAIDSAQAFGPLNSVAPNPVTNARFTKAFAAALHRPAFLPVPALALKLLLGEFGDSLLASQRVVPALALQLGFRFAYENIEQALLDIFARP